MQFVAVHREHREISFRTADIAGEDKISMSHSRSLFLRLLRSLRRISESESSFDLT